MGKGADEKSLSKHGSIKHLTHVSNLAPVISKPLAVLALSSIIASKSRSDTTPVRGVETLALAIALGIAYLSACMNDELLITRNHEYNYVTFYDCV